MKLIVRRVKDQFDTGFTTCFTVDPTAPVATLKKLIQQRFSLVPACQRLTCSLRGIKVVMSEEWSLAFYALKEGAHVSLESIGYDNEFIIRTRSGAMYDSYYQRLGVYNTGMSTPEETRNCLTLRLIQCCKENRICEFQQLLSKLSEDSEQPYDQCNDSGWACLHYTVFQGNLPFTDYLLKLKSNANKETNDGWTPLMLACSQSHLGCVRALLKYSLIQVNKVTKRGSALHLAVYRGNVDICTALLESGANMTIEDSKGRIPLELATKIEILELLPKYMGARQLARARSDPPDTPPPFAGELQYATHLMRHKVYLVIDMCQGVLSRYSKSEQYLQQKPPCFSLPLAEIQHVQRLTSHYRSKYGFMIVSPNHKSKYFSKFEEMITEWEERIIAAAKYCQKNQIGCMQLANRETFQTSEPQLPDDLSPTLVSASFRESRETVAIRSRTMEEVDRYGYVPRGEVSFSDFKIIEEIGSGSFGKVYKVQRKGDPHKLAMKFLNKRMIQRQKQVRYVLEENRIMKSLRHPFIIQLFHTVQTPRSLCFVMELCTKGDLAAHISEKERFEETEAKFYAAELLLALEYIHSKNIIFRDMKPENVLIDKDGHIRLADFGIAKTMTQGEDVTKTFCGTPAYVAPELLASQSAGKSSDIYGLGIILYEMLTGRPPFFSYNPAELFDSIQHRPIEYPDYLSAEVKGLLQKMLDRNPAARPTLTALKKHSFFHTIDWSALRQRKARPPPMSKFWEQGEETEDAENLYPLAEIDKDYSTGVSMEECWIDFT